MCTAKWYYTMQVWVLINKSCHKCFSKIFTLACKIEKCINTFVTKKKTLNSITFSTFCMLSPLSFIPWYLTAYQIWFLIHVDVKILSQYSSFVCCLPYKLELVSVNFWWPTTLSSQKNFFGTCYFWLVFLVLPKAN